MAVESTDKPVKIEVEILQDRPVQALREASRWAAMLCVGSIGLAHSTQRPHRIDGFGAGDFGALSGRDRARPRPTACQAGMGGGRSERVATSDARAAACGRGGATAPGAAARPHHLAALGTPTSTTTMPSPTATGWRRRGWTAG